MPSTACQVTIALLFQLDDRQPVVIMGDLVAPVNPENLHRHAFGRVPGHIAQAQSPSVLSKQLGDESRAFGRMNPGSIHDQDDTALAERRAPRRSTQGAVPILIRLLQNRNYFLVSFSHK